METSPSKSSRWLDAPPGMDAAEMAWWAEFADVEEKYCWVHTPRIQRLLRSRYLKTIAGAIPPSAKVLEFGCGTGWLSVLLAEMGVHQIVGVDFSVEQIRRATERRDALALEHRIRFVQNSGSLPGWTSGLEGERFDVLIIHGVLHHLTVHEMHELIGEFCARAATSTATIFMLEPVERANARRGLTRRALEWLVDFVTALPLAGSGAGWRKVSPTEQAARKRIESRNRGVAPRGPSPKEMPLQDEELLALPCVTLRKRQRVLAFSPLAARNLTLLADSYPRVALLVEGTYLRAIRALEATMLAFDCVPHDVTFELLEYRRQETPSRSGR